MESNISYLKIFQKIKKIQKSTYMFDSQIENMKKLLVLDPLKLFWYYHGMSFARSSLAISEDADIVSIHHRPN